MSEDVLDPAASPPLPPGLGTSAGQPSGDNNRRPPMLPIPRIPGTTQPVSATAAAPTAATPTPPAPTAPGTPAATAPKIPESPTTTPATTPGAGSPSPAAPAGSVSAPTPAASENKDVATDGAANNDRGDDHSDPENAATRPPISATDALNIATSTLSPALQAAMGLPATLAGLGSGLLAPFAQILSQFGQGTPAMPTSSGLPPAILDRLSSGDPAAAVTGEPGQAFQDDRTTLTNQSTAMNNLDLKLRQTLKNSAANSTLGRQQITTIIEQVNSTLQALAPIMNTAVGQAAVISAISSGLSAAGAILTQGVGKDTLNASTVNNMAADYIKDLNTAPAGNTTGSADDSRTVLASAITAGGPTAWAIQALAANGITDPRAVRNWLPGLLTIGKRESANNPRAQNNWDSNARQGIPSRGWMQTIQPTFNEHWRPGTSRNIFDPVANAAAAIHYVMSRYGVSSDGSNLMARVQQANPYAQPKGY